MAIIPGGGGGEGDSHMKQTGMLVVSLRGVNFGFWSCLGCSGQSANILSRQGQNSLKPRPDWSPLGVTKSLSQAQMVSFRG